MSREFYLWLEGHTDDGPCCKDGGEILEAWFKDYQSVQRVRELHQRVDSGTGDPGWDTCSHCQIGDEVHPEVSYPCDTIRALDGEQS